MHRQLFSSLRKMFRAFWPHPRPYVKIEPGGQREGNIKALNWAPLKRVFKFPPTFGQNLVVLISAIVGMVLLTAYEWFLNGLNSRLELAIPLLAALSAATGMLIYQERRSWALLGELRKAMRRIAPTYVTITMPAKLEGGSMALEREIHTLANRWKDFCDHCQGAHDAEMLQAEHLATMGELAAGVAHEIRNPLAGIAGAIEIITKDFPKDHPDREVMEDLRQEVRRIEKVLNDMLAYAKPKPPQFGRADLKDTFARTLHLARQQTGSKHVEFSIQVPPDLPAFRMDSEQLHQVLLNLVLNGVQAIEREGKITIAAKFNAPGGPGQADLVEISVSDTGVGVPPESLERIFRPFYTTKRGGTGLGLSLCRRIIRQHGGTLSVESKLGKGSRFIIRLPMREAVEESREVYVQ
jgi:signal transduction histidine kinase